MASRVTGELGRATTREVASSGAAAEWRSRRASPAARRLAQLLPILAEAGEQLRSEWRGHALTLTGIVWGTASIILLLSLGNGFTEFMDLGVGKTGKDRLLDRFGVIAAIGLQCRSASAEVRHVDRGQTDVALFAGSSIVISRRG